MKEIQLLCYVIPNRDVLRFPSPPPTTSTFQISAHAVWERHSDKGLHPTAPAPIHPSYLHSLPPTPPSKPRPPELCLIPWLYCVCVGSSSARLLSGAAPRHVLYAQTDDAVPLARQPRHKDNNVLPRSFINTLSSPRQPHSK